jgi:hypothetical protein
MLSAQGGVIRARVHDRLFWCWFVAALCAGHVIGAMIVHAWDGAIIAAVALLSIMLVLSAVISRRRRQTSIKNKGPAPVF